RLLSREPATPGIHPLSLHDALPISLKKLWQRDRPLIVTSLGNDSVIGQVGVPATALDWGRERVIRPGVSVVVTRNHHWGSRWLRDRKSTRLNSSHVEISYAVFCLKK